EALRFMEFVVDYNEVFKVESKETIDTFKKAIDFLKNKSESVVDSEDVRKVKGLIRRGEAKATCRFVGIPDSNVHFLDMPFYETGKVQKNPIGQADIDVVADVIENVKPHQIYAAGDLADPHGTH